MTELLDGIKKAFELIVEMDPDVYEAAWRSLWIAATSSALSFFVLALPLGSFIHFNSFPGKRLLITLIQTMFSLPAVAIGLIVFVMFSRTGPLGELGWYLTPKAMIIGQMMLITPIMLGLIISALKGVDKAIPDTATALGANPLQVSLITLREVRYAMVTALVMGFGRAISEVGISIMVGGNFRGYTRTLTTAISLETQRADLELALALGFILISIALMVNFSLHWLQKK